MKKILQIALNKVEFHNRTNGQNEFCGHLTPAEIKELIKNGAKLITNEKENAVEQIDKDLKEGRCRPTWRYFTADESLIKLLNEHTNILKASGHEK